MEYSLNIKLSFPNIPASVADETYLRKSSLILGSYFFTYSFNITYPIHLPVLVYISIIS